MLWYFSVFFYSPMFQDFISGQCDFYDLCDFCASVLRLLIIGFATLVCVPGSWSGSMRLLLYCANFVRICSYRKRPRKIQRKILTKIAQKLYKKVAQSRTKKAHKSPTKVKMGHVPAKAYKKEKLVFLIQIASFSVLVGKKLSERM